MDYRKFLAARETLVLPYFGGPRVDAPTRRLRVLGDAEPGWWRFEVEGRRARPVAPAEPGELSALPAVRGHWAPGGWLFVDGRDVERVALPPADEPEVLAPCTARRWYGGELLLDTVEFEDEAEAGARRALEDGHALEGVKGVTPALRAAFGFAVVCAAARALSTRVSPHEARAHVHDIAERGRTAADQLLARIAAERERATVEWAALTARPRLSARDRAADPATRAEAALDAAGARLTRCRRLEHGQIEVAFTFMGERFIAVADDATLQVHDAGICLAGSDREVTLDSLPSVIKEAIDTGQLVITRYV